MASELQELAAVYGRSLDYAGEEEVGLIHDRNGENPVTDHDEAAAGHLTNEMYEELQEQLEDTNMNIILAEESVNPTADVWVVVV